MSTLTYCMCLRRISRAVTKGPGARILKGPGTFLARRQIFNFQTCWIEAQFVAHKPVNLPSLADSFIVLQSTPTERTPRYNRRSDNTDHS